MPLNSTATVGVIVPMYNSLPYLEDTLKSVQAQDFADWCCIVVDDCSTDDGAELVRRLADNEPRISLLSREINGGQCAARNSGLAALPDDVPFVTFLDGDDAFTPGALGTLVKTLQSSPTAFGAFGLAEYIDGDGVPAQPGRHPARQLDRRVWTGRGFTPLPPGEPSRFADLIAYNPAWPPAVALLRADLVRAVGGFDPAVVLREDWDLFLRMSRHGGEFPVVDEHVVWYRRHDTNLTSNRVVNDRQHAAVMRKMFDDPDNTVAQAALLRHLHRRQLLASALIMLRRSRTLLAARDYRNAAIVTLAAAWTIQLAARRRPPGPQGRRIAWSHVGQADQPWVA